MQKKIISMAIIGLISGAAFAQSNVTIYGVADAGVGSWSAGSSANQRTTGVMTGGMTASRLGFKGEEALGNGLKAIFQFETAVSQDPADKDKDTKNQSGWGSNRQANVGLTGNFGTVKLGKQSSMSDMWHGGAGGDYFDNLAARNLFKNTGEGQVRGGFANRKPDSAVSYVSPTFNGFTVGGIVAFDDEGGAKVAGDKDRSTMYQIGANYANGPFIAAVTYAVQDSDKTDKDAKEWTIAATYDFKVVSLSASYEAVKDHQPTLGVKKYEDNATWQIGLGIPVTTNGSIKVGYAETDNDVKNSDVKAYQIGYQHNFSKRTTVYANYARLANDKSANYTPHSRYQNQSAYDTTVTDKNYNGVMVGIRHRF